jgi:hypothetical protein
MLAVTMTTSFKHRVDCNCVDFNQDAKPLLSLGFCLQAL